MSDLEFSTTNQQDNKDVLDPDEPQLSRRSSDTVHRTFLPLKKKKQQRYYVNALSEEDKHALAKGEKNHNLKGWDSKDLVVYHESRKELVPRVAAVDRVEKMNVPPGIKQSKNHGHVLFSKTRDRTSAGKGIESECSAQDVDDHASSNSEESQLSDSLESSPVLANRHSIERLGHSKHHHRSLSAHDAQHPKRTSTPSPPLSPSSQALISSSLPLVQRRAHTRAVSSGGYFSRSHRSTLAHRSSAHSTRVRSPLAQEFAQSQSNPNITFDSFLVPHRSGKGETYRDSEHAVGEKGCKTG